MPYRHRALAGGEHDNQRQDKPSEPFLFLHILLPFPLLLLQEYHQKKTVDKPDSFPYGDADGEIGMRKTHSALIDDECNPEEDRYFNTIDDEEDEKLEWRAQTVDDPLKDPETADNLMLADDSDADEQEEDDVLRDETDATEEKMFEQVDDADDTDN
jgi:hypothetical protein